MNELNITELNALKAQTDAVSAYAERNVYNRLEEVRTQLRDRLRRCEEMRNGVCAYLRDNWDWILNHAEHGRYGNHYYLGAKDEHTAFLNVTLEEDGSLRLKFADLSTRVANMVIGWNWRDQYTVCSARLNMSVDLYYPNVEMTKPTIDGISRSEKDMKRHEEYWLVAVPQLLRLLMKHCLDRANARLASFTNAVKGMEADSATAEANAKRYAI